MTGDEIQLLSIDEFAEKIKSKYPEYQDMDNLELATKIIEKYPEYADQVDLKKKDEGMDLPLADGFSDSQETEVTEEVVTQQLAQNGIEVPKRKGVRLNYDAEGNVIGESTHVMKAEIVDGKWYAFPTLFQNEDGTWDDTYELMIEKDEDNWMPAFEEAKKRGEVINFGDNKEEALELGKGSWKPNLPPPIDDTQEWKAMYQSAFGIDPDQHGIQEDEALRQLAQEGEMLASEPMQDRYSEAVGDIDKILRTNKPAGAIPLLNRLFEEANFSFEKEGADKIKITAPNKEELVVRTEEKGGAYGAVVSSLKRSNQFLSRTTGHIGDAIVQKLFPSTEMKVIEDFFQKNKPQELYNPNVAVSAKDLDNMVFSFRALEGELIDESVKLQEVGNEFRKDPRHYWSPLQIRENPQEYQEFIAKRNDIRNQANSLDERWKQLEEDRLKMMDVEKERNEMITFTAYSEEPNYAEQWIGEFAGILPGSNFMGRMVNAAAIGRGQGASVDESGKVWTQVFNGKANEVSEDDINNMIEAIKETKQYGQSETLMKWSTRMNKYKEDGNPGLLAWMRATAADPSSIPDLMATSFAMLSNPYILKRGAVAFGGAHTVATGVGAFGGPGGVVATNIGALPYSIPAGMLAMTATLETGLTFAQLLEEELGGVDNMTLENVQSLFDNEAKMKRFANRAVARGLAIGTVEAMAMYLGVKVAPRVANMMGAGLRGKLASAGTVSATEVFGGSLGEIAGMTMAGQPYIGEDIYLEGVGALWNAPITYGVGMAFAPKYKVNGQEWTAADFNKWINDPETSQDAIAGATIDIKNDNVMARFVQDKKATAFKEGAIAKALDPITQNLPQESKEKLVRLEMELQDLKENAEGTETAKMRINEIKEEIRIINEGAKGTQIFEATFTDEQGNEVKERVEVSEEYTIEQLKKDGINTPTPEQIKTKQQELVKEGIRTLQEKYKGVEETQLTTEEKEVADLLGLDLSGTETTEDVTENFQVNNKGQVKDLSMYAKFVDQATKASNAIKALLPNVKLILHTTEAEYSKYGKANTAGRYVSDGKQGTIHLNAAKMGDTTIGHEIFHAITDQVFRGSQEALTEFTNTMIEEVKPFLSKADVTKLEKFSEGYKDGLISEEQLSELFGDLAGNYKNLNIGAKNKVKKFLLDIANLISKKLGDFVRPYLETNTGVIDMLNALSTKVSEGSTITKEDVVRLKGEGRRKRGPLSRDQQQQLDTANEVLNEWTLIEQPFKLLTIEEKMKGMKPPPISEVLKSVMDSKELTYDISEAVMTGGMLFEAETTGGEVRKGRPVTLRIHKDGVSLGFIRFDADGNIRNSEIYRQEMQGKGLGQAMYQLANKWLIENAGTTLKSDKTALSDKAKALWEAFVRKGKATKVRGEINILQRPAQFEMTKPEEWTFRDQKVGPEATLFDYVRAGKLGNVSTKDLISVLVKKGIGHTNIKQQLIDSGIKKPTLKQIQKKQREEIKKILKISDKELTNLPSVFGSLNIGPVAGNKLFKSLTREKKGKPVLTIEQALEKLRSSKAYKNATDSQKTEMETAVRAQHELGTPREMTDRIKEARHLIRDLDSYRSLQDFKRKLKTFIRKALPLDVLKTNKRVEELLAKIDKIKHSDLDTITEEIIEEVNTINSRTLNRDIDTALKDLSKKNKPLSSKIKKWISAVDPSASVKSILAEVDKLMKLRAELEANQESLSPSQIDEMLAIRAAENILLSYTMRENQIDNVSSLSTALQLIQELSLVEGTRQKLEAQETHERYNRQRETILTAILGKKVDISTKKGRKAVADAINELKEKKNRRQITKESIAKKLWNSIKNKAIRFLTAPVPSAQDLHGLMAMIDKMPGELFGGVAKDLVVDLVNRGTREFKKRSMMVENMIEAEMIRLWGKDRSIKTLGKKKYTAIVRNLNKKSVFLYTTKNGEAKVKEAVKKYENGEITQEELTKIMSRNQTEEFSQAELAYLYMHYKNKETHPAFKAKFGKGTELVMEQVNQKLDPKLKEFSNWQMDVLFPQLYEHYNIAYRDLYRTDMPQVQRYGGRLYRDNFVPSDDFVDLIAVKTNPNASVFAASINERTDSKSPILITSSINSLFSYVNNMEYFAAMGRPVRDMNKMFTNKDVRDAIVTLHGQDTYDMIKDMIQKIANRGVRQGGYELIINKFNTTMTLGSLAIQPVIMIKQLTSFITYASKLGFGKWASNFVVPLSPQFNRLVKEINDNSVYLQYRYKQSIIKSLETFAEAAQDTRFEGSQWKGLLGDLSWAAMTGVRLGDYGAIIFGGLPNYKAYKAEAQAKGLTGQDAIDYAIKKFEDDTKSTQQSADIQDKDYFQTSNFVTRGLNMFMTTPKQYLRKELTAIKNIHNIYKGEGAQGSLVENMRTLMTYHVILPAFFQYITSGLPGLMRPWRDDDWKDFARVAVIGNLNAFFILGDVFNLIGDAVTQKPWTGTTKQVGILSIVGAAAKDFADLQKIDKDKNPEKYEKQLTDLYARLIIALGVPAPSLVKWKRNFQAIVDDPTMDEGEIILRLLNWSEYQITGPKTKEAQRRYERTRVPYNKNHFE